MTEQHTPERLRVADDGSLGSIETESGKSIGQTFQTRPIRNASDHAERIANARRLVACWNRLDRFTTEQIENQGYDLFADVRPNFDRAMQERDELLKALKLLWHWTKVEHEHFERSLPDDFIVEAVEGAIAKVEGGAA